MPPVEGTEGAEGRGGKEGTSRESKTRGGRFRRTYNDKRPCLTLPQVYHFILMKLNGPLDLEKWNLCYKGVKSSAFSNFTLFYGMLGE